MGVGGGARLQRPAQESIGYLHFTAAIAVPMIRSRFCSNPLFFEPPP